MGNSFYIDQKRGLDKSVHLNKFKAIFRECKIDSIVEEEEL